MERTFEERKIKLIARSHEMQSFIIYYHLGTRVQATSCSRNGKFKPVVSSVCYNNRLDAVVYHKESCTTYLFLGAYLWRMDDAKRAGQRERISSVFRGLTGNIDAAYARSDGSVVFFRNNQ